MLSRRYAQETRCDLRLRVAWTQTLTVHDGKPPDNPKAPDPFPNWVAQSWTQVMLRELCRWMTIA